MEDPKHTPGPWEQQSDCLIVTQGGDPNLRVCIACHSGVIGAFMPPREREANIRLIAAAPDLLEVVQGALKIQSLWMPPDEQNDPEHDNEFAALATMRQQMREAVAKAIGQTDE